MRRLSTLVGAMAAAAAMSLPTAAVAHASLELTPRAVTTTPTPSDPAPSAPSQQPVVPASGGSTTATDALTVVGFSVVAMAALVLLLRAGLRSAGAEDDD